MTSKETLNHEKKQMRLHMRNLLHDLHSHHSENHRQAIFNHKLWTEAGSVLLYSPLPKEPDPTLLMLDGDSRSFIFPRIEGRNLGLYRFRDGSQWIVGPFGLREPHPETWERVSPELIDLAFIPGLAFDRAGNRLGRGAGYYDGLLGNPHFRGVKIGYCWKCQLLASVPAARHDIPMDHIVTEVEFTSVRLHMLDKSIERE